MTYEKQRQKFSKDLDEKEEEIEELRCNMQKKVKQIDLLIINIYINIKYIIYL